MSEYSNLIKKKTNFTQISNKCLHDYNLNLDTKGLLCVLASYPNNWKFYNTKIAYNCKIGKEKLNKLYNQLELYGYLKRIKKRDKKGKFNGCEFEICDEGTLKSLKVEIEPIGDLSTTVKSVANNTNLIINTSSNDDYQDKMNNLIQKLLQKQLNKDIKIQKLENLAVSTKNQIDF